MNNIIETNGNTVAPKIGSSRISAVNPVRSIHLTIKRVLFTYPILIVGAELITIFVGVIPGLILYALLLIGITNLIFFSKRIADRKIYLMLIPLPLLRILSLTLPLPQLAPFLWYILIGIPLLFSTLWIVRVTRFSQLRLNLNLMDWIGQYIFGMSGIPLGVIAFLVLKQSPDINQNSNWIWIIIQLLTLTLFGAISEEIIFRGLIQQAFSDTFGYLSIFITSVLYACMFIGTLSIAYILFFSLTGLLFSIWVHFSKSLWGSIVAHTLLNIVFILLLVLV
jgi:CAAX protease family protein